MIRVAWAAAHVKLPSLNFNERIKCSQLAGMFTMCAQHAENTGMTVLRPLHQEPSSAEKTLHARSSPNFLTKIKVISSV